MALASLDEKIALRPAVGVAEFTEGADSDEIALKALKAMSERV
jgi:hypothetical protein